MINYRICSIIIPILSLSFLIILSKGYQTNPIDNNQSKKDLFRILQKKDKQLKCWKNQYHFNDQNFIKNIVHQEIHQVIESQWQTQTPIKFLSIDLGTIYVGWIVSKFPQILSTIRAFYYIYKSIDFYHLNHQEQQQKQYRENFSSMYGGAVILSKSSKNIKSVHSILDDSPDRYMYTDANLPITLMIRLNQEVAIDQICIKSNQMYSSITKKFRVEGAFISTKWIELGTYQAKDNFNQQCFQTDRKIVRYVKFIFQSVYGKWTYFTLTQIKVHGKGLFADAQDQSSQKQQSSQQIKSEIMCVNTFEQYLQQTNQPHDYNLITMLKNKIEKLQSTNIFQNQKINQIQQQYSQMINNFKKQILDNNINSNSKQINNNILGFNIKIQIYAIILCLSLNILSIIAIMCIWLKKNNIRQQKKKLSFLQSSKKLD